MRTLLFLLLIGLLFSEEVVAHTWTQGKECRQEVSFLPREQGALQRASSLGEELAPITMSTTTAEAAKADTLDTRTANVTHRLDSLTNTPLIVKKEVDSLAAFQTIKISKKDKRRLQLQRFTPDPKRALWLSLVLPGAGQIYNRKYWKLPIFYGGFLGCTYAFLWNQQMYRDYSQAYLDIMDNDANTKSYLDFLPPNYSIEGREEQFQRLFKNRRDRFRRYRDMSGFAFIGVYLLSVIDAYVDAQLSEFDISPDLSLRIKPAIIGNSNTLHPTAQRTAYGIGCALRF